MIPASRESSVNPPLKNGNWIRNLSSNDLGCLAWFLPDLPVHNGCETSKWLQLQYVMYVLRTWAHELNIHILIPFCTQFFLPLSVHLRNVKIPPMCQGFYVTIGWVRPRQNTVQLPPSSPSQTNSPFGEGPGPSESRIAVAGSSRLQGPHRLLRPRAKHPGRGFRTERSFRTELPNGASGQVCGAKSGPRWPRAFCPCSSLLCPWWPLGGLKQGFGLDDVELTDMIHMIS